MRLDDAPQRGAASQVYSLTTLTATCSQECKLKRRGVGHPLPPSQHVSQIVWQREHCNLARISISSPPQAGQAGRGGTTCSSFFSCSSILIPVPRSFLTWQ